MKKALLLAAILSFAIMAHVLAQPPRAARTLAPKIEVLDLKLPDARVQETLTELLLAIENDDYERFVAGLTIVFRANVDEILFKQMFESIGTRMAPRYSAVYMGELNKPGFKTFIFKLVFNDKRNDVLLTLSFNADAEGNIVENDKEKLKSAGLYLH